MIKAVIFDCFGVLVREGWFAFLDTYFSDDVNRRKQAVEGMSRMGTGLISHDEFIEQLAQLAGVPFGEVESILTDNPPDEELFDYIAKELKPKYKIAILSNAGADRTVELFGEERAELFDEVVLSFQIGAVKPDAHAYETTASRLGVAADECIFIDDQERYCVAAEQIGMKAVFHENTKNTIAKIEELLYA